MPFFVSCIEFFITRERRDRGMSILLLSTLTEIILQRNPVIL
jgi:hypothetical protein